MTYSYYVVSARTSKPLPTAHISVQNNRVSHKKLGRDRVVFFPKSTEFQIELTNNFTDTVLARIKVNGKSVGNAGLVLRPGEHVYLDRFLESPEKFLFDIYSVDNTKQVKKAIENNGIVEVEFYHEAPTITYTTAWSSTSTTGDTSAGWIYYPSTTAGHTLGGYTTTSVYTCDISNNSMATRQILTDASSKVDPQLETGRVEKGSKSGQKFKSPNKSFENIPFHTELIKIMPLSRESTSVKVYCVECGRRFRKSEKYCSQCGTKK